jgi:hypothetical protein
MTIIHHSELMHHLTLFSVEGFFRFNAMLCMYYIVSYCIYIIIWVCINSHSIIIHTLTMFDQRGPRQAKYSLIVSYSWCTTVIDSCITAIMRVKRRISSLSTATPFIKHWWTSHGVFPHYLKSWRWTFCVNRILDDGWGLMWWQDSWMNSGRSEYETRYVFVVRPVTREMLDSITPHLTFRC